MRVGSRGARRIVAALGCAALLLPVLSAARTAQAADKTYVMKLSTATLNDAQHAFMKLVVAAVDKASGGRIKGQIYPASQLGPIPRQIEGTQFGSIQGWIGPPEFLSGIDPRFELLSAPGLFDSMAHVFRVVHDPAFAKTFLAIGTKKGLVGVTMFIAAPSTFSSRAPIRHLAEFKGKKIRVLASAFQMGQMKQIGAVGVPMTLGDVLPALQQGTIDGAMGSVPVFEALHYYDAGKYMTETNHAMIVSAAMLSRKWLESLPADLRKIVLDQFEKVGREMEPVSEKLYEDGRKSWIQHGGELIELPASEQAQMMKEVAAVGPAVVKGRPAMEKLYDELVKTAAKTKK
jgi:TRAP-type C4-dicarboxylate transport system substrate-binding protein